MNQVLAPRLSEKDPPVDLVLPPEDNPLHWWERAGLALRTAKVWPEEAVRNAIVWHVLRVHRSYNVALLGVAFVALEWAGIAFAARFDSEAMVPIAYAFLVLSWPALVCVPAAAGFAAGYAEQKQFGSRVEREELRCTPMSLAEIVLGPSARAIATLPSVLLLEATLLFAWPMLHDPREWGCGTVLVILVPALLRFATYRAAADLGLARGIRAGIQQQAGSCFGQLRSLLFASVKMSIGLTLLLVLSVMLLAAAGILVVTLLILALILMIRWQRMMEQEAADIIAVLCADVREWGSPE